MKRFTLFCLYVTVATALCIHVAPAGGRAAVVSSNNPDQDQTATTVNFAAPRVQRSSESPGGTTDLYANNMRVFQILGHLSRNLRRRKSNQQTGRSAAPSSENLGQPWPPRSAELRSLQPHGRTRHLTGVDMIVRPVGWTGRTGGSGGELVAQALRSGSHEEEEAGKRGTLFATPGWESAKVAAPVTVPPPPPRRVYQPELLMMSPPGGPGLTSAELDRLNTYAFTSNHWGPLGRKRASAWAGVPVRPRW